MLDHALPQTLPALLAHAVATHAERPFVRDGDRSMDFLQLDAARRRVARAMLGHGIRRGDRVAIWAPNRLDWILAATGAQSIGAIMVPLNTRLKGAEAAYILNRSGARLLFTVSSFAGNDYPAMLAEQALPALERIVLLGEAGWDDFLAVADGVEPSALAAAEAAVQPSDTLDLMFTSGTTGKPKGVMTSHAQNIRVFDTWSRTVGLRAEDNYLVINPFFHTFGYKAGWLASLIRGTRIFPVAAFDVLEVLRTIQFDRISMLPGPPTEIGRAHV